MNPLNGIAMLFEDRGFKPAVYLGTCFAFRNKTHFLTAAHCVVPGRLAIVSPTDWEMRPVVEVRKHPEADLALMITSALDSDQVEPFWDCVGNYGLGEDFMSYGFPEDSVGPNQGKPVPRLFKGYYQRFMPYRSGTYRYIAGEISIPCPGGLSGGPLFRPGASVMVTGVVAENVETTTLLHEQEQVVANGQVVNEHYRRVVNYGVVAMLSPAKGWLDANIPPRQRA